MSDSSDKKQNEKVVRLIEYLQRIASLRSKVVRNIADYERILWISDVPHEKGCFTQAWDRDEEFDSDIWIEVQNQKEPELPDVPAECKDWAEKASLRNKADFPEFLSEITIQVENLAWQEGSDEPEYLSQTERIEDHPEVQRIWERYVEERWLPWMENHNRWESVHKVYSTLFAIHQEQIRLGEEYELVLGLGLLTWKTPTGQRIRRHLIVANAILEFESRLGKFTIRPMPDGAIVRPELDMLDIEEQPAHAEETAKSSLVNANDDPWEKDCIEGVLQALVHSINSQGEYDNTLEAKNIQASTKPVVKYAPVLVLRKRSVKGLAETLRRIKESIEKGGAIPGEFADLAEIRPRGDADSDNDPGDISSEFDGEVFFPKPSNKEQRRIVDKLRGASGVLVQGPPGTGKSHTIANLICHLLATGQRILVTAKTPRALQVLGGLVPDELRPLCINLLGSGLDEKRSLESSVGGILRKNEEWNENQAIREREDIEQKLRNLREEKAKVDRRLRAIRESETHSHSIAEGTYRGTAARIAMDINRDRSTYEWFTDKVQLNQPCPIRPEDLVEVVRVLQRSTADKRQELRQVWPESNNIPTPQKFAKLAHDEKRAMEDEKAALQRFPIVRSFCLKRARSSRQKIEEEIRPIEVAVSIHAVETNTHRITKELLQAIRNRDVDGFARSRNEIQDLEREHQNVQKVDEYILKMRRVVPKLTEELERTCNDTCWEKRIEKINNAWHWAQARFWVEEYIRNEDAPSLAKRARQIEDEISTIIAKLASLHAWSFCFSRLEENHRRHMEAWQQSMRRLGKGTGKYAPRHRREAQQHLNECREAVPAWVMPLHRVWDTVDPSPGMFDLIIVDEASQCGVEALPLFYLGTKILIVGDDKQISPEVGFIDKNKVFQLMEQFLYDFDHKDSFHRDASLFDHGKLRYGTRQIILREHFRCMPEIIRFSNDLCYSDTSLIPLRQYGPNRLAPLEHFFVEGGYREGPDNRVVNKPEADAIVEKIVELCGNGRHFKKTMGVVVLQGDEQAHLIEGQLLERMGADEMKRRHLICGNPYSFQGDERDIMFLSMVAASNERIGPLTKAADERRFNVAESRARDQMYLFHSVTCDDLSTFCLRRRLLEFFENTKSHEIAGINRDELERRAVQDNRVVVKPPKPFDSWFEIDVALELARKGFEVIPQYKVDRKRIDLVVEGGQARLAVECDGDHWHGSDRYEEDMERQRQLGRGGGWEFFRVRESVFRFNKDEALEGLWRMLEERDIFPRGTKNHVSESDNDGEESDEEDKDEIQESSAEHNHDLPLSSDDDATHAESSRRPEEISSSEISDGILHVLEKCPNCSCTLQSLAGRVLKEVGVLTRGKPRSKFEKRVMRKVNALDQKGLIEKYKATNERVRLLKVSQQENLFF
ncbi:MAG: AAA family ATPase [Pirellulales bacterium]|nr:AAA family ATPase [Pirellulales bacterium]